MSPTVKAEALGLCSCWCLSLRLGAWEEFSLSHAEVKVGPGTIKTYCNSSSGPLELEKWPSWSCG